MSRTRLGPRRRLVVRVVLLASLALAGAARAQPAEEAEPAPADAATPDRSPAAAPAAPIVSGNEPAASAAIFERMGPDTYPGRLRGIRGGSLWLEPTFHGLQWPRNTRTGIGVSGLFSIGDGYETIKRDQPMLLDSTIYFQQGRGLLRVTPAYVRDGFFIQGQAELVANACQAPAPNAQTPGVCAVSGTFTTDDLWIRVGHFNVWDLKVGRFEGWEIYHFGMGLEPHSLERLGAGMFGQSGNTGMGPKLEAPFLYGVNYLQSRPAEGLAVGFAALHLYVTDYLRFELLGKWGSDNYQDNNATVGKPYNYLGARPTAILDVGWFKLKVGGELQKGTAVMQTIGGNPGEPQAKKDPVEELIRKGVGASLQFVIDPIIEFGVNAAIGRQDYTDASANAFASADTKAQSFTTKSAGAFANARVAEGWLVGAGGNWTDQLDSFTAAGSSAGDYTSHLQGFAALQCLLADRLFIKGLFAYAKASFQPSDFVPSWSNSMYGGSVRLTYLY